MCVLIGSSLSSSEKNKAAVMARASVGDSARTHIVSSGRVRNVKTTFQRGTIFMGRHLTTTDRTSSTRHSVQEAA